MESENPGLESALDEFSRAFELKREELRPLKAFENFVFEGKHKDEACILRVSRSSDRAPSDLEAEIHWVKHLRASGLPVAQALPSVDRKEIVSSSNGDFLAVLLDKVPGIQMSELPLSEWTPKLFCEWGRTIGQFHRVTTNYTPGPQRRMQWHEDPYVEKFPSFVQNMNPLYLQNWRKILDEMGRIPKTEENFGLIHDDLHSGNFCLYQDKLQIFDTDDCKYQWLLSDVATIIQSVALGSWGSSNSMICFLEPFWKGYRQEFPICSETIVFLPLLLRFRAALVFGALCRKWDLAKLGQKEQSLFDRLENCLLTESSMLKLSQDEWQATL